MELMHNDWKIGINEEYAVEIHYPLKTYSECSARVLFDITVKHCHWLLLQGEISVSERARLINIANFVYNKRIYGIEVLAADMQLPPTKE